MPKLIFDDQADWDQNVENVGIDTSVIKLDAGATPLQLADDFEDGVLDPLWVQGHSQIAPVVGFDPPGSIENFIAVTNLRHALAQSFTLPISFPLAEISLKLQLFPSGSTFRPDVTVEVQTDNSGEPSGTVLASYTENLDNILPIGGFTAFPFNGEVLPINQKLWIVFKTNPIGTSTEHLGIIAEASGQDLPGENLMFLNGSTQQWQQNTFGPDADFHFLISREVNLNTKPAEVNGALRFEYAVTSGSGEHIHALRDFAQGDWEMEYRFTLNRLAANFNSGQFIIGMLQGNRVPEDGAARDAKILHEFRFNIQDNFVVSYEAAMVDQAGTVHTSGSGSWPNINFTPGFIANDPHVFNVKAERVGNGLKYTLYHSDNPANILLETQTSPDVRTLSGDIHVDMGATSLFNTAFGVAIDIEEIFLNTPPQQVPTGFLRLRHSFGVKTKLENFEFQRSLPAGGDIVEIQFRSGSTIAELESAVFGAVVTTEQGSFNPGNPQSEFEKAILSLASAEFFETKISLTGGTPGPTCQQYILEFTEDAPAAVVETGLEPLAIRRHIDSDGDWSRFVEKSSSIEILSGMVVLSPVFTDGFDGFVIDPEWTVYQRNASIFESFGFLRMDILSVDADAAIIKTDPIPTTIDYTVRHKINNASTISSGAFFLFNIAAIHNNTALPTPNDLRIGGIGTGPTHFTVILRRSQFGDGQHRIGIVALRDDGTFLGWDENTQQWSAGTQDQVIPGGLENDLFSYEVSINNGVLNHIIVRDEQSNVVFDTSAQTINLKIFDNDPYLVLGDSDLSDMPAFSGTQQQWDSVETNIPTTGSTSGFIRFRDEMGARARLGSITVLPSTNIQIDPAPISIRARSGDTLDELLAASFVDSGQFIPDVLGNTVDLTIPPGKYIEVELNLFSQSPGPEILLLTWELDPFIEGNPVFLSLDNITPDTSIVSSANGTGVPEDQATVPHVKDGNPLTQWVSTTGTEGFGVNWLLHIIFQNGTTPYEENIDTIILRNTNFKKISITATDITQSNSEVVFSGEVLTPNAIITFPSRPTAQIFLSIENSQNPNENKVLGEIYMGSRLAILDGFDSFDPNCSLIESGNLRTLGGKLIAYRGRSKYNARFTAILVDEETKDLLKAAFNDRPLISTWFEPLERPFDLFDVGWNIEVFPFPYSDVFKKAGFSIEGEVTEI